ncbi:MAG TPA: SPOR domain-containing protein [Caulobacteraceae bacterium]|jgi:hypothetical protein
MRAPLAALIGGLLWASGAWGQAAPPTIDPAKAKDWLERTFGIVSVKVVEATPDQLVTLRSIEPQPPSDFHAVAHIEDFRQGDVLTPPSSDEEYFINCPSRRFHVDRIESFSQNGARGSQSTTFGPTGWGKAVPNSTESRVIAAVCGPVVAEAAAPAEPPPASRPTSVPKAAPTTPTPSTTPSPAISTPKPLAIPAIPAAPFRERELSVKPGPARVQLFAGDRQAAQRFVDDKARRLPAGAGGGKPEIVQATVNGRPVFRVQVAGFASAADAARYCSAVRSAGLDCFVPPAR